MVVTSFPIVRVFNAEFSRKGVPLMGTSKNYSRHAELVSASPYFQEIAGQARNDGSVNNGVFRSSLILFSSINFEKFLFVCV